MENKSNHNTVISGLGPDLPESEDQLFQLDIYPIFDYKDAMSKAGIESGLKKMLEITVTQVLPEELTNLKAAHDQGDWGEVSMVAHKLKGGSFYCGMTRMTFACQYMERYYKAGHNKLLEKLYQQLIAIIEETDKVIRPVIDTLDQ